MGVPIVDPEFRDLIPPLNSDERSRLQENILAEGCRDLLVVWAQEGILLDGHNRLEICLANDIPFRQVNISLEDRDAACDWILHNQLGRRNLTPNQFRLLLGRRYGIAKQQGARSDLTSGKNCQKLTAESLAAEHGVSGRTVRNAGEFAEAYDAIRKDTPDNSQVDEKEIVRKAKEVVKERKQERQQQRMPAAARGKFSDFQRFTEICRTVKDAVKELKTLRVDINSRDGANTLCKDLAEQFAKLAQDVWEGK